MIRERVIRYVKERGIKQSFISEKTGMTQQCVSAIMNEKRDIEVDEYVQICKALGLPCSFFFDTPEKRDEDALYT